MEHIHKKHNASLIIYHLVCPAKYRREIFSEGVSATLKQTCLELGMRYEINFLEIGADNDHVHFLVQTSSKSFFATGLGGILKYSFRKRQN